MKTLFFYISLVCVSSFFAQEIIEIDEVNQAAILQEHNKERALLNISDLTWNEDLAAYAQEWALQLAEEDKSIHH